MSFRRLLRIAQQRLAAVFRRDTLDDELSRELAFHYEHLVRELIDEGMPAPQARLAARKSMGNVPLLEEQCRDHRAASWLHDMRQDLMHGARMLRRSPGFTFVAVASLALGIGANTAVLSTADAVFRHNWPIPRDDRLVVLRTFPEDNPRQETHALVTDYFAWRDGSRSFERMGASLGGQADFGAHDNGAPAERIPGQSVTPEALSVIGVQPIIGRLFTEDEGQLGAAARVIVISHRLWQRRYGARADILGQQVRLDRVTRTVIGVMPEGFRYPSENADYWVPMYLDRSERLPSRFFVVTARLKQGVTMEQAQAELRSIAARLADEDPDRHAGWSVRVKPLREAMLGWGVAPLATLGAAVALVLLVACANLAGLLLARGLARRPEMALRNALGAGRGRLVRQLLTESLLLTLAGGILGTLVAWAGMKGLATIMIPPPGGVRMLEVGLNPRVLAVTALLSIATGLLFGLAPALMSHGPERSSALKELPAGTGPRHRFRNALVAAQIAVTVVLLVRSGLLMKSFLRVLARDLNFDPQQMLTFEIHTPLGDYLQRRGSLRGLAYFEVSPPPSLKLARVFQELRDSPGVESVAGTSFSLVNSIVVPTAAISLDASENVHPGAPPPHMAIGVGGSATHLLNRGSVTAAYFLVTPGFFTAIRARLVQGRDFADRDDVAAPWVAIVNETAAARYWPGENAVGQRFRMPNVPEERPREVIGVIRDIPLTRQGEVTPVVYASYLQQPGHYPQPGANMFGQMVFMVRTAGDPTALIPTARRIVGAVDPDRPLTNLSTMDQRLGAVPQRGYFALVMGTFAIAATVLAAIGIYGVMAYSVTQRTREIGVRLALGARAREVMLLVGRHALVIVALGMSAGLAASLAFTQLLRSQLWSVTPTDPTTFALVSLLLALVALAAAYIPLRRAAGVNPIVALRE